MQPLCTGASFIRFADMRDMGARGLLPKEPPIQAFGESFLATDKK